MKSIKARFEAILEKNPYLSTLMAFNQAVWKQGFSKRSIQLNFNKLVDEDDYAHGQKRECIEFAQKLSEEGIK